MARTVVTSFEVDFSIGLDGSHYAMLAMCVCACVSECKCFDVICVASLLGFSQSELQSVVYIDLLKFQFNRLTLIEHSSNIEKKVSTIWHPPSMYHALPNATSNTDKHIFQILRAEQVSHSFLIPLKLKYLLRFCGVHVKKINLNVFLEMDCTVPMLLCPTSSTQKTRE